MRWKRSDSAEIVGWVVDELPEDKPRHLLGIGEPEDLSPASSRAATPSTASSPPALPGPAGSTPRPDGAISLLPPPSASSGPIEDDCDCPTCASHTVAYLHHLLRTNEYLGATLLSLHNLRFYLRLVDQMRAAIVDGEFDAFKQDFLGRYTVRASASQ